MLTPSLLWQRERDGVVKCFVCQRYCTIPPGKRGYCGTRVNREGELYSVIYGMISSAAVDPIEKKPVYHYCPGTSVFSVGTVGCNFRCRFCQNSSIAFVREPDADSTRAVEPQRLIAEATASGAKGLAWTYNEPVIWLEYVLDTAKLAKEAGLYTILVTNGFASPEALDIIAPWLDVYRVDLKAMEDSFYSEVANVTSAAGIRDVAQRARNKWGLHVEVVTNLVPGLNDSVTAVRQAAAWIVSALGPLTPWHLTRFHPAANMQDKPATPAATLERSRAIALEQGLSFVYVGNFQHADWSDTICPTGGETVIRRRGYRTELVSVDSQGCCAVHGDELNLRLCQ